MQAVFSGPEPQSTPSWARAMALEIGRREAGHRFSGRPTMFARMAELLFGLKRPLPLANPELEALRRKAACGEI